MARIRVGTRNRVPVRNRLEISQVSGIVENFCYRFLSTIPHLSSIALFFGFNQPIAYRIAKNSCLLGNSRIFLNISHCLCTIMLIYSIISVSE